MHQQFHWQVKIFVQFKIILKIFLNIIIILGADTIEIYLVIKKKSGGGFYSSLIFLTTKWSLVFIPLVHIQLKFADNLSLYSVIRGRWWEYVARFQCGWELLPRQHFLIALKSKVRIPDVWIAPKGMPEEAQRFLSSMRDPTLNLTLCCISLS